MPQSRSRSVILFAPVDVHSFEIAGAMDVFHEANRKGGQALYDFSVIAETTEPIRYASGLRIIPDRTVGDGPASADAFIVTGSYVYPNVRAN